jgi:hypothetical protein
MKIFMVSTGSYSDYSPHSLWSTEEKANEMKAILDRDCSDANDIQEFELDAVRPERPGVEIYMDVLTGNVEDERECVLNDGTPKTSCNYGWIQGETIWQGGGHWYSVWGSGGWKPTHIFPTGSHQDSEGFYHDVIRVRSEHITREQAIKAAQDKRAEILAKLQGVA